MFRNTGIRESNGELPSSGWVLREPRGGTYHDAPGALSTTTLYRTRRADIFPTIFETWAELFLVSDITEMPENELPGKNSVGKHK